MVMTIPNKRGDRHLRTRHVKPTRGIFHVHHPVVITARHNPADAQPGGHGFGEGAAQQDAAVDIKRVDGARARVVRRQLAVNIILDDDNIVALGQGQHLAFTRLRHDKPERVITIGHQDHRFNRPLLQGQLQRFDADPGLRIGGDLNRLDIKPTQHLHGAVERRRLHRHNIPRLAHRQQRQRQRPVTAVGDHNLVRRYRRAAVQHQAGDLLAQLLSPLQHVVAQHFSRMVLGDAAHLAPQGFQARLVQIRRTAAKRDHFFIGAGIEEHHHLIPLGHLYRTLDRAGHRRNGRLCFA